MKRLIAKLLVAAAALALAGFAAAIGLAGDKEPPGRDPCSHGVTGKPCRPDPQPNHGKDCEKHGNNGGVNEDHCSPTHPPTTTGEHPPTTGGDCSELHPCHTTTGEHPPEHPPVTTTTTVVTTVTVPSVTVTVPGATVTVATPAPPAPPATTVIETTPGATVTVEKPVAAKTPKPRTPKPSAPPETAPPPKAKVPPPVTKMAKPAKPVEAPAQFTG